MLLKCRGGWFIGLFSEISLALAGLISSLLGACPILYTLLSIILGGDSVGSILI